MFKLTKTVDCSNVLKMRGHCREAEAGHTTALFAPNICFHSLPSCQGYLPGFSNSWHSPSVYACVRVCACVTACVCVCKFVELSQKDRFDPFVKYIKL